MEGALAGVGAVFLGGVYGGPTLPLVVGMGVPTPTLAAVLVVLFVGGVVMGVAGFGYAVVGTTSLALLLDPATAVVVMILPMLATNVQLVRELDAAGLATCARRFWLYILAAAAGTLVGMTLLDRIPTAYLALGLGVLTGLYVVGRQPYAPVPGERALRNRCFRTGSPAKAGLGFASGLVFGASNVAVQIVAYLDSLDLGRDTFVGVLAMVLVGISTLRVGAAWVLGLYATPGALPLSVAGVVPGVVGVAVGRRTRDAVPGRVRTAGVLLLLSLIAVRLAIAGVSGILG